VAQAFGITAPFWLAFAVMVVFTACAWRLFSRSALDFERQQVVLAGRPRTVPQPLEHCPPGRVAQRGDRGGSVSHD
jgi:hypothetical protein